MTDAGEKRKPAIRRRFSGEIVEAGKAFRLGRLNRQSDVRQAIALVIRKVTAGHLEVEAGDKIVGMLRKLQQAQHDGDTLALEREKLNLLEDVARKAPFLGFGIVAPAAEEGGREMIDVTPREGDKDD